MRPLSVLSEEARETWGEEAITKLADHYGREQEHSFKDKITGESCTAVGQPLIDREKTLREWDDIKDVVLAKRWPRDITSVLWSCIRSEYGSSYPNLIKLAHLALSSPVHTADCERGFSAQNHILTKLRNRLTAENQDLIMRVKLFRGVYNIKAVVKHWEEEKDRRNV